MSMYIEHHNWKKVKNTERWMDTTVKYFNNIRLLEKYILQMFDRYPTQDISYTIYDGENNIKGNILAVIHYKNCLFSIKVHDYKWFDICKNNNIFMNKNKIKTIKTA